MANEHGRMGGGYTGKAVSCPPNTSGAFVTFFWLRFWQKMRTARESGVATDRGGANVFKSCLGFK